MKINNSYIKATLRKIFLYSDLRQNVIQRCKEKRGVYICEECGAKLKIKEIQVHHIDNNLNYNGDWNLVINNMFCSEDKLKCLCKNCHQKIHKK